MKYFARFSLSKVLILRCNSGQIETKTRINRLEKLSALASAICMPPLLAIKLNQSLSEKLNCYCKTRFE